MGQEDAERGADDGTEAEREAEHPTPGRVGERQRLSSGHARATGLSLLAAAVAIAWGHASESLPSWDAVATALPLSVLLAIIGLLMGRVARARGLVGQAYDSEFWRELATGFIAGAVVSFAFTVITTDIENDRAEQQGAVEEQRGRQQTILEQARYLQDEILENVRFVRTTSVATVDVPQLRRFAALSLVNANLSSLDLRMSDFDRASLCGANLKRNDLTGAVLTGADLTLVNADGVSLRQAALADTNLTGTNLVNADLTGADLRRSLVRGSYLVGADLSEARLEETRFIDVTYDDTTSWPEGFDPPTNAHGGWWSSPCPLDAAVSTQEAWLPTTTTAASAGR